MKSNPSFESSTRNQRPVTSDQKPETRNLLTHTRNGWYCPQGDFYIDPTQKVDRAIITHAHADHSRWGMKHYLSHHYNEGVMKRRLGKDISFEGINYGEKRYINGVQVSFHPAGHIPGSAQIRLEYKGDIWVITGDYKCNDDGLSTPFELVKCHHFITESTFGLPVFNWESQDKIIQQVNDYWASCVAKGEHLILTAYSLGKAQRLLNLLDRGIGQIHCHGAIVEMNRGLEESGALNNCSKDFHDYLPLKDFSPKNGETCLFIMPPSGISDGFLKKLKNYRTANCSGWMALRGRQRWDNLDKGFVISDHADWKELIWACKETGAEDIRAVHGYTEVLEKYLVTGF